MRQRQKHQQDDSDGRPALIDSENTLILDSGTRSFIVNPGPDSSREDLHINGTVSGVGTLVKHGTGRLLLNQRVYVIPPGA